MSATAKIVEIAERGLAVTRGPEGVVANTELLLKTKLRIAPGDGQPAFEITTRISWPQMSVPAVGKTISVIYDPDDPSDLIVDPTAAARAKQTHLLNRPPARRERTPEEIRRRALEKRGLPVDSPPPAPVVEPEADRIGHLERLAQLKASGALTEEEFQAEKAKVLGSGT